jgi:hypothetical protein
LPTSSIWNWDHKYTERIPNSLFQGDNDIREGVVSRSGQIRTHCTRRKELVLSNFKNWDQAVGFIDKDFSHLISKSTFY